MNNRLWINLAAIVCLLIGINLKGETIQITDANISRNTTWTANNQYVLNGLVFVEEGETLTIEPGTVIKGKSGQGAEASALVVARGGKIFAEGTAEAPIIFTAEADDVNDPEDFGSTDRGLWGGVIVLGRATLNSPSAVDHPSPTTSKGLISTKLGVASVGTMIPTTVGCFATSPSVTVEPSLVPTMKSTV